MGKLIFTADDYGACDFIDNGIVQAVRAGKINTVTAFVTHPDSQQRIADLLTLREELKTDSGYTFNIGLHFSVTSGFSLQNKASSLTEDTADGEGKFYFREAKDYTFLETTIADLEAELLIQLQTLDAWLANFLVDHVSNHHNIAYLDMRLYQSYVNGVSTFTNTKYTNKIPIRSPMPWQKSSDLKVWPDGKLILPIEEQGIELGMWKMLLQLTLNDLKERETEAQTLSIKYPDYLADTIYGDPYPANVSFLIGQLSGKDYSSEFMFHLGHPTEAYTTDDELNTIISNLPIPHGIDPSYFVNRTRELDTILNLDMAPLMQASNVTKAFFTDL